MCDINFDTAYTHWTIAEIESSIRTKAFYEALEKRQGGTGNRWIQERHELESALAWHKQIEMVTNEK